MNFVPTYLNDFVPTDFVHVPRGQIFVPTELRLSNRYCQFCAFVATDYFVATDCVICPYRHIYKVTESVPTKFVRPLISVATD